MKECPYRGLVPYREKDAEYFFGRETERRIIADNLRSSRLTILYGPSGAGKTSVLRAGVAYDLKSDPDYGLVVFDSWLDDPVIGLHAAITRKLQNDFAPFLRKAEDPKVPLSLRALLEAYSNHTERTLLIVLDQFEAYFQYHPFDRRDNNFRNEFPILVNSKELPVHFLLVLREDSLFTIDRFKADIPTIWDNRLSIGFLSREAAYQAILHPLRVFKEDLNAGKHGASGHIYPIEIEDQVATDVVNEILAAQGEEQQGVQAAYLQLVMARWWECEAGQRSPRMRREMLRQLGGATTIVRRYLEDTLATLTIEEKQIAAEIFRYMVTPAGRAIAQTVSDLAALTRMNEEVNLATLENLLETLQTARLLTPVAPPRGTRPDDQCYEFGHDVIAKAASDWRQQFLRAQELAAAEKRAAQKAAEEERLAAQKRELEQAQALAREQSERAEEKLQSARRLRLLVFLSMAISLLLALMATLAWTQRRAAIKAEKVAEKEREAAIKAQALANVERETALKAQANAEKERMLAVTAERADRNNRDAIKQYQNGNYNAAIAHLNEALRLYKEIENRGAERTALANLGTLYQSQGNFEEALSRYRKALTIEPELDDRASQATLLLNIGDVYLDRGEIQSALSFFNQSLSLSRKFQDHNLERLGLYKIGTAYRQLGQLSKARTYIEEALLLTREFGDRRLEGLLLNELGLIAHDQGNIQQAIMFYEKALVLEQKIDDRESQAMVLDNMASLYRGVNELSKALDFSQQASALRAKGEGVRSGKQ